MSACSPCAPIRHRLARYSGIGPCVYLSVSRALICVSAYVTRIPSRAPVCAFIRAPVGAWSCALVGRRPGSGRQGSGEARGICAAPGGFSCGSERPFPDKVLCPARFFMKAAPFRVRATLPASRPVPLRTSPGSFSGPGSSPGIGRCLRNQKTAPAQFCAGAVKRDQLKKSPSFLSRSYLALAFASALLNSSFARSGNACARRAYRASPMMKS